MMVVCKIPRPPFPDMPGKILQLVKVLVVCIVLPLDLSSVRTVSRECLSFGNFYYIFFTNSKCPEAITAMG